MLRADDELVVRASFATTRGSHGRLESILEDWTSESPQENGLWRRLCRQNLAVFMAARSHRNSNLLAMTIGNKISSIGRVVSLQHFASLGCRPHRSRALCSIGWHVADSKTSHR